MTEFVSTLSGTQNDMRDYLARELLDYQPPHIREILLQSSVLNRLAADVCQTMDEVRDQARCAQLTRWQPVRRETSLQSPIEREMEVLRLVTDGFCNKQIADHLVLEIDTVEKHVSHLLRKLDAENRTQAVARARALGSPPLTRPVTGQPGTDSAPVEYRVRERSASRRIRPT